MDISNMREKPTAIRRDSKALGVTNSNVDDLMTDNVCEFKKENIANYCERDQKYMRGSQTFSSKIHARFLFKVRGPE